MVYTQTGEFLFQWGRNGGDGTPGSGDGEFNSPCDVAINATGHVYVADADNNRVQVFTQTGQFLFKWNKSDGSFGNGPGEFYGPQGITLNSTGHVYVADTYNHRIQVFSQTGQYLFEFGTGGAGDNQFNYPMGMAFNATGDLYIVDFMNNRVKVHSMTGQYLHKWGFRSDPIYTDDGEFNYPCYLAINKTGQVYVSDGQNNRVQVFTQTGQFLLKWGAYGGNGSSGTGDGEFNFPEGIAVNNTDHIYIAELSNCRIQVFGDRAPVISNVLVAPGSPKTADNLVLSYDFSDPDGDGESGTTIRWYVDNVYQPVLNDLKIVPATFTNKSQHWNTSVTPRDGTLNGTVQWSSTIIIGNSAPQASSAAISPTSAKDTDVLTLSYVFQDNDGDAEQAPRVQWYRNGILQPSLDNQFTVPAELTSPNDQWYAIIEPFDSTDYGNAVQTATVTIPSDDSLLISLGIGIPAGVIGLLAVVIYRKKKQSQRGTPAKT